MSAAHSGKGITVLVVDEEDSVRTYIWQALEKRGFSVLCAKNGAEALFLGERHPGGIHLLITDLIMPPYLDGVELAHSMRRQRPGMKVLFISNRAAGADVHLQARQGQAVFLPKPFTSEILIRTVLLMLSLPASRSQRAPAPIQSILMLVPEEELRARVARLLREESFMVLEARSIGEALGITQWHAGSIGLLLADGELLARLPAELQERLGQDRPEMRILCASACGVPGMPLSERVRRALEEWGMRAMGGV